MKLSPTPIEQLFCYVSTQLFCCERAQKMRAFLLEEERALASMEMNRKIDVGPHPPFMNKHEKRAAKERAEQRWEDLI